MKIGSTSAGYERAWSACACAVIARYKLGTVTVSKAEMGRIEQTEILTVEEDDEGSILRLHSRAKIKELLPAGATKAEVLQRNDLFQLKFENIYQIDCENAQALAAIILSIPARQVTVTNVEAKIAKAYVLVRLHRDTEIDFSAMPEIEARDYAARLARDVPAPGGTIQ
jgi:hypothetical protein